MLNCVKRRTTSSEQCMSCIFFGRLGYDGPARPRRSWWRANGLTSYFVSIFETEVENFLFIQQLLYKNATRSNLGNWVECSINGISLRRMELCRLALGTCSRAGEENRNIISWSLLKFDFIEMTHLLIITFLHNHESRIFAFIFDFFKWSCNKIRTK